MDYTRFTPHAPLADGLLTVLEQMPGVDGQNIVWMDMTPWLRSNGYWASYNRPFFPWIQQVSDQQKMIDKYGDHFSWHNTSRAVLFRAMHAGYSNSKLFLPPTGVPRPLLVTLTVT